MPSRMREEKRWARLPEPLIWFPPPTDSSSFSSLSSSQETPGILEKRRTESSPGGVDRTPGEEDKSGGDPLAGDGGGLESCRQ